MRSLTYRLTGEPKTLNDCVYHAQRHRLRRIDVEHVQRECPTDITVHVEFIARLTWHFDQDVVTCEVLCGAYREDGMGEDWGATDAWATTYLRDILHRLTTLGFPVVFSADSWKGEMNHA